MYLQGSVVPTFVSLIDWISDTLLFVAHSALPFTSYGCGLQLHPWYHWRQASKLKHYVSRRLSHPCC